VLGSHLVAVENLTSFFNSEVEYPVFYNWERADRYRQMRLIGFSIFIFHKIFRRAWMIVWTNESSTLSPFSVFYTEGVDVCF